MGVLEGELLAKATELLLTCGVYLVHSSQDCCSPSKHSKISCGWCGSRSIMSFPHTVMSCDLGKGSIQEVGLGIRLEQLN